MQGNSKNCSSVCRWRCGKLGDKGCFKVTIFGKASHKWGGGGPIFIGVLGGGGLVTPLDTMGLSNYYYVFVMTINKLTISMKVSNLTKNLINWPQKLKSNTKLFH